MTNMTKNKIIKDKLNCFMTKYSNLKGSYRRFVWLLSICLLSGCSGIKTINGVNEQRPSLSVPILNNMTRLTPKNQLSQGLQDKMIKNSIDQNNPNSVPVETTTKEGAKSSSNQSYTSDGIWKNIGIFSVLGLGYHFTPSSMLVKVCTGGATATLVNWLCSEKGVNLLTNTSQKICNMGQSIYECCKAHPEACYKAVFPILVGAGIGLSGIIGYEVYNSLTSNQEELYSLAKQDCGFIEKIGGDPDKIESAQFKELVEAIIRQSAGNLTTLIYNCQWGMTKYPELMGTSNSMVGPNDVAPTN